MELHKNIFNASEIHIHMTYFINDSQRDIFMLIVGMILSGIVSLFGIIANIINMTIYFKQGLKTTINISFYSMAISDLGSQVFQQLCNVYNNPLFVNLDLPIVYIDFQYITTAVIRMQFARITCLLTVYVTAERCFCIAFPLHVKQMLTLRRTTTVVVTIYSVVIFSGAPVFCISYFEWNFYSTINKTLLGLVYRQNTETVAGAVYLIQALFGALSFIIILILTTVLICKLAQKNTWLKMASADMNKSESVSKRDKATMRMVTVIASVLIICYSPSVMLFPVTILEPEFAIGGKYNNLFTILWTLAVLLENINSSVNIFFYYNMSTKYRKTFRKLFLSVIN